MPEVGEWGRSYGKGFILVAQGPFIICHFQLSCCPRGGEYWSLLYILSSGNGILSSFSENILCLTGTAFASAPGLLYYFAPQGSLCG